MLKKPKKDTFYEQNKKFSMEKEAMSTLWAHDLGIFKNGQRLLDLLFGLYF